jgi:Ca-activated chloride channel family protein
MAMRKLLPLFLVLGTALPALAQRSVPTILVQNEGKTEPLGLIELNYEVRIVGYFAETSATMTFANSSARSTEGELYFPLPAGATVSGYALDINGAMVDGVSLDKQRAAEIFEMEKRRQVDPGLVEWTTRDHFHTRVFPIPGGGRRTVRVRYVSELEESNRSVSYRLPLGFASPIPKFSLKMEVVNPAAEPKIARAAPANFRFAKWREGFLAETNLENALLKDDLLVALPDVEKRDVQVEKADDGQVYFAIHDRMPGPPPERAPFRPRRIALYWDASGSRAAADHEREFSCLRALLKEWTGPDRQSIEINLLLLRNALSPPRRFYLAGEDLERLIDELKRIGYDGATQLGALAPLGGPADCSLLFSDGVSTIGRAAPPPLAAPLYVFSTQSDSDWGALERLADANGGRCFDLARQTDAEVLTAIAQPAYRRVAPQAAAGRVAQMLSSSTDADAKLLSIVGRLESPQAAIELRYHSLHASDVRRTFALDAAAATSGSLLSKIWAQRKLNELVDDEERNRGEIAALGRRFGIVTPFTSLMVLETLQQYVMYGVEPPDSSPQMKQEYLRLVRPAAVNSSVRSAVPSAAPPAALATAFDRQQRNSKVDEVVRLWQQRLKWWATDARRPAPAARADRSRNAPQPMATSGFGIGSLSPARPAGSQPQGGSMSGGFMGGMGGIGAGGMGGGMDGSGIGLAGGLGGSGLGGGMPLQAMRGSLAPPAGDLAPADGGAQFTAKSFRHFRAAEIALQPRDPGATYLRDLRSAADGLAYATYMKARPDYARSPDFYLDCADFFFGRHETTLAIQVLSNLAELGSGGMRLRRLMGRRLAREGEYELAIATFEDVLRRAPDEPQSYRDLALLLAQRADDARYSKSTRKRPAGDERRAIARTKSEIAADYTRAMELLTEIVARRWDGRYAEIELPVLMELNRLRARASTYGVKCPAVDPRLGRSLELDLRVVLTWCDPDADVHLVVTEPGGEKASTEHSPTRIGGLVSRTSAVLGPEEYLARRALNGEYVIEATFPKAAAPWPVTIDVAIFTNFGREKEQRRTFTVRIDETAGTTTLGKVRF